MVNAMALSSQVVCVPDCSVEFLWVLHWPTWYPNQNLCLKCVVAQSCCPDPLTWIWSNNEGPFNNSWHIKVAWFPNQHVNEVLCFRSNPSCLNIFRHDLRHGKWCGRRGWDHSMSPPAAAPSTWVTLDLGRRTGCIREEEENKTNQALATVREYWYRSWDRNSSLPVGSHPSPQNPTSHKRLERELQV